MKILAVIILIFAFIGAITVGTEFGKASVRWSKAIDELIYQRKQRKK